MPRTRPPDDAHEWVSFEDLDEERTWVFDVTFLTSSWRCLYGAGCQGVLTAPAPERQEGCCSYGAHFADQEDRRRVEAAAATLDPTLWQHRGAGLGEDGQPHVAVTAADGTTTTRLVDDACIFLNRPGFPGGSGCALHRAALARGVEPLTLKPEVCWQLPLRRDDQVADDGHVTTTVRQWDRRHWGEGGQEFSWWCTEAPEAFSSPEPVYRHMAPELTALVGPATYRRLVAYLDARATNLAKGVALPHPALRRRRARS